MNEKTVLILERSSQNLQKINDGGKTILEGVFAEFGKENRNGRIYEESEYLPHLEYLKKDIANGNLLGELDHPERFEVALGNVSHRITELWYDQSTRQVKGRIEILERTPKGQIAKALLESGVPLSISSRAAGSVNPDKTVQIQQIYTYDLVTKPGFEKAQLHTVNEGYSPAGTEVKSLLESMNNNREAIKKDSINGELGIINENISIIDMSDKEPTIKLREEAKSMLDLKNKKTKNMNEAAIQEWTVNFNKQLDTLNERLNKIEAAVLEGTAPVNVQSELKLIKGYIEKSRKLQESAINWQTDIAKAVNKIGNFANEVAKKSNEHYTLTKKIVEAVDYNAKTLNFTQDWITENAKTVNAIGEAVDHNANMLNHVNEWTSQIAKGVNALNEWGVEKAKAINNMHEWTSDIAKNLNITANYAEEMFGRTISKKDAKKLVEYVELVSESKSNPQLRNEVNEMLKTNSITSKVLDEAALKGIKVIDTVTKVGNVKVGDVKTGDGGIVVDPKMKVILSKDGKLKFVKSSKPKELKTLDDVNGTVDGTQKGSMPKMTTIDKTKVIPVSKTADAVKPNEKTQNLKLNTKQETKLKESEEIINSINVRSNTLNEKLSKIIELSEKERALDEEVSTKFPFVKLLAESDRKRFVKLSETDKQKVAGRVNSVPTVESNAILKLWETALSGNKPIEPKWLELAPKQYRDAYDKSSDSLKESLQAKSEFFNLDTQYQIDTFWETSGVIPRGSYGLNESMTASSVGGENKNDDNPEMSAVVNAVGSAMQKYNNYL